MTRKSASEGCACAKISGGTRNLTRRSVCAGGKSMARKYFQWVHARGSEAAVCGAALCCGRFCAAAQGGKNASAKTAAISNADAKADPSPQLAEGAAAQGMIRGGRERGQITKASLCEPWSGADTGRRRRGAGCRAQERKGCGRSG